MAAELRWILLALCVPLLAGIWWWSTRRSTHAPGNSLLREPSSSTPIVPDAGDAKPVGESARPPSPAKPERPSAVERAARPEAGRSRAISPLAPLEVRDGDFQSMHADFGHVPVLDMPMMVNPDPVTAMPREPDRAARFMPADEVPTVTAVADTAPLDATPEQATPATEVEAPSVAEAPSAAEAPRMAEAPRAAEEQRIVSLRVCARGELLWGGAQLLAALESFGLAYGRYQIFHRKHTDGRSLYCVASLAEPGTFDLSLMGEQEFKGVTLFAVLPGPLEGAPTFDDLLATAVGLAEELAGVVQDAKGVLLSPERAAALRGDAARFQAALPRA